MSKKKRIWLAVWLIAVSQAAVGAEWSAEPGIQLRTNYDDNIYLTTAPHKSIWGISVSPRLLLAKRTPNSEIALSGRATFNHYSQKLPVDPDAQNVTLESHYDTLLNKWGLDGYYTRETTSATITVEQPVNPNVPVTGTGSSIVNVNLVPVEVRQNELNLHPSLTRTLTPRTTLGLGYGFDDVFYDSNQGTFLTDYHQHGFGVGVSHRITQRDAIGTMAHVSLFRASTGGNEANNYGVQLTYAHDYSQTLHGTVRMGARYTTTTVDNLKHDNAGFLFTAILDKQYSEVTSFRFILERTLLPSGAGEVVPTDHFEARLSRDLSPRYNFALWSDVFNEKTINANTTGVSRLYVDVEPSLRYRITRQWTVDGSYRYGWQKYRGASSAAQENAVYIALNYNWPRLAISR